MQVTSWPFIEIDERGIARIQGLRTKVTDIALDLIARGLDAQAIVRQRPHLTLPQVHLALAYYYHYQAECDLQLAEETQFA